MLHLALYSCETNFNEFHYLCLLITVRTLNLQDNKNGSYFMLLLSSADFFFQNSFKNTISVSNGLDPDQDHFIGPDLGPNCANVISR